MAAGREECRFELYECQVCLLDMVDRRPRFLQCHHSFCQDCLLALLDDNILKCPTCRQVTEVKGGIESLSINFHLVKMREREKRLINKELVLCQLCYKLTAVNKCLDCSKSMCQECTDTHESMKHDVKALCIKHSEGATHVCMLCIESACALCKLTDHADHGEDLTDYDHGLMVLKEEAGETQTDMRAFIEYFTRDMEQIQGNIDHQENVKAGIQHGISVYKERVFLYQERINAARSVLYRIENTSYQALEKSLESCRAVINSATIKNDAIEMIKGAPGFIFLPKYKNEKKNSIDTNLSSCDEYINLPVQVHEAKIKVSVPPLLTFTTLKLSAPKIVLHLGKSDLPKIESPNAVVFEDGDSLLVADTDKRCVTRISAAGEIVKSYQIPVGSGWGRGVSYFNGYIYMTLQKKIIRMNAKDWDVQIEFKPGVELIRRTYVLNAEKIIITEEANVGRIFEYNPENGKLKAVVENLNKPSYVTVIATSQGMRYVVTIQGSHCLHVYNSKWELQGTIGNTGPHQQKLHSPHAAVVTHRETILVADKGNNRICEFNLDGSYLGSPLSKQNGIKAPGGLAFRYPYLWLTEWSGAETHASIKCFQFGY